MAIKLKNNIPNRWKELHDHLERQSKSNEKSAATAHKEEISKLNGWSNGTFYRKMKTPGKLSISEKLTIAQVYNMPVHFLFPEMELVH